MVGVLCPTPHRDLVSLLWFPHNSFCTKLRNSSGYVSVFLNTALGVLKGFCQEDSVQGSLCLSSDTQPVGKKLLSVVAFVVRSLHSFSID